jgi:hypothetical protein
VYVGIAEIDAERPGTVAITHAPQTIRRFIECLVPANFLEF